MKAKFIILMAILAVVCWAGAASADRLFTIGDPATDKYAATANFSLDDTTDTLTITLTNTSQIAPQSNAELLQAFFWQGGDSTLTLTSIGFGTVYSDTDTSGGGCKLCRNDHSTY